MGRISARLRLAAPLLAVLTVASLASCSAQAEFGSAAPTLAPVAAPELAPKPTDAAESLPGPVTSATLEPAASDGHSALALLATLPIKGKAPKTSYDRTGMFGSAWLDVDRNGCDTRNDMLQRDFVTTVK